MSDQHEPRGPAVPPQMILHQEGVIAVIAMVGLWLRDGGLAVGLAARGSLAGSLGVGLLLGGACFAGLFVLRVLPPLRDLETWQRRMVEAWTPADVVAVAVFSGLAEEALVRALLQPLIGLLPAAAIFAVLHVVPDRRLWLWPAIALILGLALGWIFERAGYPAAAAAHVLINGLSLARLSSTPRP